ncbi:helix-turn-helix domain-containing protein, partial [Rivularia sp. UHCC 0363]|uniref:helix-turn-helix domain-containing protein n=1 Tax=Rivularia sp. UHCC 0363 TaxID=3110244 RepID=UPI002B2125B8
EIPVSSDRGSLKAARLLKICTQRVRQLLYEGRIVGAKKVGRFWRIPVFKGMPKIEEGKRGPKGTWRKRLSSPPTFIHVNSHKIKANNKHGTNEPVIIVKSGSEEIHAHNVKINGSCEVIYSPNDALPSGAMVWIAVNSDVVVKPYIFADME